MLICLEYCKNCGVKYMWQASGSWDYVGSEKLGTREYCFDCNKIVSYYENLKKEALEKIDKISIITSVETNEVTLDQLLEWKRLADEEIRKKPFGMVRCYPSLARQIKNGSWESDKRSDVIALEGELKNRQYFYIYWPSEKENAKITVKVRQDTKTGKILEYVLHNTGKFI